MECIHHQGTLVLRTKVGCSVEAALENDTFLYVLATSQPLVSAVLIQGRVGSSSRVFQRRTERLDMHAQGSPKDYISHLREMGMA